MPFVKKLDPSEIEVLDRNGESLTPKQDEVRQGAFGIRVIRTGPWVLLFLPVLIPLLIAGFFLLLLPLFLFGRRMPWPKR